MVDNPDGPITTAQAAASILRQDTPADAEAEAEGHEAEQGEAEEVTTEAEPGDEAEPEAEAEASETEQEEDDPSFTITLDGKEQEVTLTELLNGYQRHSDYTRKTTAVADTRKKLESAAAEISQKRNDLLSRLEVMGEALGDKPPFSKEQIDQAKADQDYVEANRMFQENMEWKEHRQTVADERNKVLTEARQEALDRFNKDLPDAIPDWADRKTAETESQDVYRYLRDQGYDDGWIGNLVDAKAVAMIRKSMLFDRQQKEKPKALKKVQKAPKMLKPGTPRPQSDLDRDAEKKLLKTVDESSGRVALQAAASFLKQRRG